MKPAAPFAPLCCVPHGCWIRGRERIRDKHYSLPRGVYFPVLGLKARDLVGYSFVQLLVHIPLVLFLLWFLGQTLSYIPPVMP